MVKNVKTKLQLLEYYYNPGLLNDDELKRLYYHIFGCKAFPDPNMNLKYLVHSLKHPEIYKTRFNR